MKTLVMSFFVAGLVAFALATSALAAPNLNPPSKPRQTAEPYRPWDGGSMCKSNEIPCVED